MPWGFDDGKPGLDQETDMIGLTLNWDINDQLTLTSVTSVVELDHVELDDYSYGAGVFGGLHRNVYEHTTQEFRLASNYEGSLNFQAGVFYQDIEQQFDAYQYAFNLAVMPNIFGPALAYFGAFDITNPLVGPDPATGNMYDYNKDHYLDTEVISAFFAFYRDINERTELTIGARYTEEEKVGRIEIPYVHAAAVAMMAGYKTLLISTEMPTNSISLRTDIVLANMMGYDFSHKALRNGDAIDEEAYKDFLIKLNGRKMLICDHIEGQQGMTLDAISGLVRKHQPDFIVLDGVYLVTSGDSKKAMWEQSHSLFYGLKNLCMSCLLYT